MMKYLLNALPGGALIGHRFAGYPIEECVVAQAVRDGEVESAVGHAATAAALSIVLGVPVPERRVTIQLAPGDIIYVAALRGARLAEGQVLTEEEVRARGLDFLRVEILSGWSAASTPCS